MAEHDRTKAAPKLRTIAKAIFFLTVLMAGGSPPDAAAMRKDPCYLTGGFDGRCRTIVEVCGLRSRVLWHEGDNLETASIECLMDIPVTNPRTH